MGKVFRKIKHFWSELDTLDDRIYFLTVSVSILAGIVVVIANFLQGLSLLSQITGAGILLFTLLLLVLGIRFPRQRGILRVCLVFLLNFVFFPISFFSSGGIYSGMILFFLVGLFTVAIMLRGNTGGITFTLSLLAMMLCIEAAQHFPGWVAPMSPKQHYQDVKVTLLISGLALYTVTMLIFMAYNQERKRNEELMETLRSVSVRDALSGLFNRRELFRRLEIMYGGEKQREREETLTRKGHYIVMFDVDDFKSINDTYGHGLGDEVLAGVARVMDEAVDLRSGELAARYGGEEFVCVLAADSFDAARRRVEQVRIDIAALTWEKVPKLRVTVSGGLLSCMEDADLTRTMHDVDELLYQAKTSGKNRICVRE